MSRPNLILFNPDHYRTDVLGHMGNEGAVTPNLDRFVAEEAISFRNNFSQSGFCTPSRCSFMSGMYPHTRGHRTMFHMLGRDDPMLLREFKKAGYFIWWGGKNDVVPAQYGFDDYCDIKYRPSRAVATDLHVDQSWRSSPENPAFFSFFKGRIETRVGEQYVDSDWANVLGAIDQLRDLPKGRPFCLYLPLYFPHPPYAVEDPYFSMIDRSKVRARRPEPADWTHKSSMLHGIYKNRGLGELDEEFWNELRAVMYAMCTRVDAQFGMLLEALRESGHADDTAVLFYSDHGAYVGDYGIADLSQNTFEDVLLNIPLIIKPPKGHEINPGIRNGLVEMVDFKPTIEELCDIAPTHSQFGKSLTSFFKEEQHSFKDAVFAEGGRLHGETQCMELEYEPGHTDPRDLYYPRLILQTSEGPEHTKAAMCRTHTHKYVMRFYERDELYDLEKDPEELINRIDDPEYREISAQLKERLLRWYMETSDIVPFQADQR